MACNCATKEQIDALYKKYGDRNKIEKNDTFKVKAKKVLLHIGIYLCMIPIVPFLALYVLYKGLFDDNKRISMRKFFRLKGGNVDDVRNQ